MEQDSAAAFQTAFWGAKRAMREASEAAFRRLGVRGGQEFILRRLWDEDGLSPGAIAAHWGLATPTVTRAATRMEAAGILTREADPWDRRRVRLRLTARGRDLQPALERAAQSVGERALCGMSAADRATLVRLLAQISRNLGVGVPPGPQGGEHGPPRAAPQRS